MWALCAILVVLLIVLIYYSGSFEYYSMGTIGGGLPNGPFTSGADLRFAQVFTGTDQQEYSTPRNADVKAIAAALAAAGDPSMTINTPHATGAAGSDVGKSTDPVLGFSRANNGNFSDGIRKGGNMPMGSVNNLETVPGRKREYFSQLLPSGAQVLATGERMDTRVDVPVSSNARGGCACKPGRACKCAGKCKKCAVKEKLAVGGSPTTASGHMFMCHCSKCKKISQEQLISQGTFPAFWENSRELDKYRDDDRLNYFGLD